MNGNARDRRAIFASEFSRVSPDLQFVSTIKRDLQLLAEAIADLIDKDERAQFEVDLAQHGLRLRQVVVPELVVLADLILDTAGATAVRTACEPRPPREGTDLNGRPWKPRPSEFSLPERFHKGVVARAVEALSGA